MLHKTKKVPGEKSRPPKDDDKRGKLEKIMRMTPSFEEQLNLLSPPKEEAPKGPGKTAKPRGEEREERETKPTKKAPAREEKIDESPEERIDRLTGLLDYEALDEAFTDEKTEQRGLKMGKDLEVLSNGGLFMEAINLQAERDYNHDRIKDPVTNSPEATSNEEKLHVPARADDVAQRWAIVSRLCLQRGIVNWKVAKQDLLQNKISGGDKAFTLLSAAGLLDKGAERGAEPYTYVKQALKPARREHLRKFLGKPDRFESLPEWELSQQIILKVENAVLDEKAFPEEQSGREITVYIKPKLMANAKQWSELVSDLYAAFEDSGLPMLPIASGDQKVAGGGKSKDGQTCGYFSYRNEANASDEALGYTGFPHWMGGNHDKANAAGQKMQLDGAKVKKRSAWKKSQDRKRAKKAKKKAEKRLEL